MKKNKIITIICLFLLIFISLSNSNIADDEKKIEITSMLVNVDINNGYSITEITASISNPFDENLDGTFNLLIPDAAFVSNFSLTIDNQKYFADILEKQEAEQKYNESKSEGKTAGIVESRDMKQFAYTINLKAGQIVEVTLIYEEYLEKKLGERKYNFALSSICDEPISQFMLTINLYSEIELTDLDKIESSNITEIEWISLHQCILSIKENNFLPIEDFSFKYSESSVPINGKMIYYYNEMDEQYYFFHIFSPPKADLGGYIPKDIIFVLDKSGSMSGQKISQLKDAFIEIISQMPENDRFTIIMFDTSIDVYSSELLIANEENINSAVNYINNVASGGSTDLYDGLEKSLEILDISSDRTPIILLLTDGLANCGTYSTPISIREHIKEANNIICPIFTLGFGDDVDFNFLTALSLENYANSKRIFTGSDAGEQIKNFYDTISTTLLRDIEINYNPECQYVIPITIPCLFEGSESVISGVCSNTSEITSEIIARTKTGTKFFNSTFNLNKSQNNNMFVYRFWAYSRINYLLDEIKITGEKQSLVDEIVNLSLSAHFVTDYTALYLEVNEYQPSEETPQISDYYEPYNYQQDDTSATSIPGFELFLMILAITLFFYLRNKRRK